MSLAEAAMTRLLAMQRALPVENADILGGLASHAHNLSLVLLHVVALVVWQHNRLVESP